MTDIEPTQTALDAEAFVSDEEGAALVATYLTMRPSASLEELSALGWLYGQAKLYQGLVSMAMDGELRLTWPEGEEEPRCLPVEGGTA
jgi:hypothetical protein